MPRAKRIIVPHYAHHLIQRGNNKMVIFFDDEDRNTYLRILKAGLEKTDVGLHAYVRMDNHVHLLATPLTEVAISKLMQFLGGTYVQYINEKMERTGTLFEGRYRSSVVDSDEYFFTCSRYIEENPVRAGMCNSPGEHVWSSFQGNAQGDANSLLTPHSAYDGLGRSPKLRAASYARMFVKPLAPADVGLIASTIEKFRPLGSAKFIEKLEKQVGFKISRSRHGGDRKSEKSRKSRGQTP